MYSATRENASPVLFVRRFRSKSLVGRASEPLNARNRCSSKFLCIRHARKHTVRWQSLPTCFRQPQGDRNLCSGLRRSHLAVEEKIFSEQASFYVTTLDSTRTIKCNMRVGGYVPRRFANRHEVFWSCPDIPKSRHIFLVLSNSNYQPTNPRHKCDIAFLLNTNKKYATPARIANPTRPRACV